MKIKVCFLLVFGFLLFVFSNAEASITWSSDNFDYNATDAGGYYYNLYTPPAILGAASDKSQANGASENSDSATAVEPQQGVSAPGVSMASGAWGNSFQNLDQDTGGATVYAYANSTYALDDSLGGLFLNGQSVSSYIDRYFTVSSNQSYTISASAAAPMDWSGTATGTATVSQPNVTGWVYLLQTDTQGVTTTVQSFALSGLVGSPQQATVSLVSGDFYQLVVAISNVDALGNKSQPAGIVTSFNNIDSSGLSLGNLDGNFNIGAPANPVTITASLAPFIVVDGACGSSNGGSFASAPSSDLCSSGTASTISGAGPWTWTCTGQNGGANASCSANIFTDTAVDGACGSSDGGSFASAPSSNLCGSGTASTISGAGPWTWTCTGLNGGANASCSANISATETTTLWEPATPMGNDWYSLSWFGQFYTHSLNPPTWIYGLKLGWLYPVGTSTDSIWFYDPRWDNGSGAWWWTSSSTFPWVYSVGATENGWYYYDTADSTSPDVRWFCNSSGCAQH